MWLYLGISLLNYICFHYKLAFFYFFLVLLFGHPIDFWETVQMGHIIDEFHFIILQIIVIRRKRWLWQCGDLPVGLATTSTLMSILLNRWKASASPSLFLALLSFHPPLCHQRTVLKCKRSALLSRVSGPDAWAWLRSLWGSAPSPPLPPHF